MRAPPHAPSPPALPPFPSSIHRPCSPHIPRPNAHGRQVRRRAIRDARGSADRALQGRVRKHPRPVCGKQRPHRPVTQPAGAVVEDERRVSGAANAAGREVGSGGGDVGGCAPLSGGGGVYEVGGVTRGAVVAAAGGAATAAAAAAAAAADAGAAGPRDEGGGAPRPSSSRAGGGGSPRHVLGGAAARGGRRRQRRGQRPCRGPAGHSRRLQARGGREGKTNRDVVRGGRV